MKDAFDYASNCTSEYAAILWSFAFNDCEICHLAVFWFTLSQRITKIESKGSGIGMML